MGSVDPGMMQYLAGLNATVASATAGVTTPVTPQNQSYAPGFQAPQQVPQNTQFAGSSSMMSPAMQEAAAQDAQKQAQQNGQQTGGASGGFVQQHKTALEVAGGAAALAGAFAYYKHSQNSSDKPTSTSPAAGEEKKPGGTEEEKTGTKPATGHDPAGQKTGNTGAAHENGTHPPANHQVQQSGRQRLSRSSSHSSEHASTKGGGKWGGVASLVSGAGSLFKKGKAPSFQYHGGRAQTHFGASNGRTLSADDPKLTKNEREYYQTASRMKQEKTEATANQHYQASAKDQRSYDQLSADEQRDYMLGQKAALAQKERETQEAVHKELPEGSKEAFTKLSAEDRNFCAKLPADERESFIKDPKAFRATHVQGDDASSVGTLSRKPSFASTAASDETDATSISGDSIK